MDGSIVHFPARAPQKIRAGCLLLTRESRGGSLALVVVLENKLELERVESYCIFSFD